MFVLVRICSVWFLDLFMSTVFVCVSARPITSISVTTLILISLMLALPLMGADNSGCGETEEPKVEGGGKTARVGQRLTLKGTSYRVTSVRTAQTIGDGPYTQEKANGRFVVVKLTLTNRKDEPATILEDNIRLIGGNGKNYSTSDDAIFALGGETFILEEIQPDVSERGTLVYDIPKKAVSGARLQVEDLFSDSKGQIRLGL